MILAKGSSNTFRINILNFKCWGLIASEYEKKSHPILNIDKKYELMLTEKKALMNLC